MEAALSSKEIEQMRTHFRAWLRWLMEIRPEEFPTQRALAKALDVSDASVTYWLKGARSPALETAVAVSRLTEFPIDYMLRNLPPPMRSKGRA